MTDVYNNEPTDIPMPMGGEPSASISNEEAEKEATAQRQALVKDILKKIQSAKTFYAKAFKRMREDMKFAAGKQWPGQTEDEDRYVANVVLPHVQHRVSSLYAKNPRAVAKRRPTLDYQIWDEKADTLMQAMQTMQAATQMLATMPPQVDPMTGQVMPPQMPPEVMQAQALLSHVQQGKARADMIKRIGKTLEILFHYYLNEPSPRFKLQAKQLVRRVVTCAVGYIQIGFQRVMGKDPMISGKIADFQAQLQRIQRLTDEMSEGELQPDEKGAEELRLMIQELQTKEEIILREGLVFDFPKSTAIIIDPECTQIKGFVGARWVAKEFIFTPEKVKEIYGADLKKGEYTAYAKNGDKASGDASQSFSCGYEFYDKESGLMYTVVDGYCDFLEEPAAPPAQVEQFFPFFALTFNDTESEGEEEYGIYPPSDVSMLRNPQKEINRSREGLRQHRIANQPQYAASKGALQDDDKTKLTAAMPHEVVELNALLPGQKIEDVLQQVKKHGVDPNMYDTSPYLDDMQRVGGAQDANVGAATGDPTATEANIAEGSRLVSTSSAIDDLDDILSDVARASGQILLKEISPETAKKIAGVGAVWPQFSQLDIVEELYLEIKAGSSGRPNKAQHIANIERIMPFVIQMPGMNPVYWGTKLIEAMDDDFDVAEAIVEGMPSIVAQNSAKQPSTGDPSTDPAQQGNEGKKGAGHERANDTQNGATKPGMPANAGMAG